MGPIKNKTEFKSVVGEAALLRLLFLSDALTPDTEQLRTMKNSRLVDDSLVTKLQRSREFNGRRGYFHLREHGRHL